MLNPSRLASVPGSHHVSAANFWPESRTDLDFPEPLRVIDSTLRKTYFTAGNATTQAGYLRIAEALVELGVTVTCLNVTWSGAAEPTPQDWELMTTVLGSGLPLEVNVWSDILLGNGQNAAPIDWRTALHRFVDAGATTIAPGIVPAPDADAEKRQDEQLEAYLEEATRLGIKTTVTLAGIGLRDFDQLVAVSGRAVELGVARLDLMDSSSSLSPHAMHQFVRRFRAQVGTEVPVTMHAHDEFGMATAAAIAATAAGAHPDVSINGMSYRCGFAPLEEVVLALEVLYGVDTGINVERIMHASEVVARESQLPVPALKPLTGSYAHLKHMPGDAAAAIRTGQGAFPPISHGLVPARMGAGVRWVWGGFSSNDLTVALAESQGIILSDAEVASVRQRLDDAVAARPAYPRWLEPGEATALLVRAVAELRGQPVPHTVAEVVTTAVPDPVAGQRALEVLESQGIDASQLVDPADDGAIRAAVRSVLTGLSTAGLIQLLDYFKRFDGTTAKATSPASEQEEQAITDSPGSDRAALTDAAVAYERHFGFVPVVRAAGRSAADVTAILQAAVTTTPADELARVRDDVCAIIDQRVVMAAAPGGKSG